MENDDLDAVRGIINSIPLSLLLWGLIIMKQ
jgi:hypothetical protein